jgi:purine-binding chemotaxis protein CheW
VRRRAADGEGRVKDVHMNTSRQYCSFHVADLFFGVEVQVVQEVIRYQEMTQVPLAAREVGGLINLRGQIVTAIDLRRRLGLPDRPAGTLPMNVIIRTDDAAVSLLVDEIGDVLELDTATFEPSPETLRGVTRELVSGVHKLPGGLLLLLDTTKAIDCTATAVAA